LTGEQAAGVGENEGTMEYTQSIFRPKDFDTGGSNGFLPRNNIVVPEHLYFYCYLQIISHASCIESYESGSKPFEARYKENLYLAGTVLLTGQESWEKLSRLSLIHQRVSLMVERVGVCWSQGRFRVGSE
jgi:hypothetical protein